MFKILSYLFIVFLILISIISIFATLYSTIVDEKKDTIYLTNIGFAVLLALGNICFSWSRALFSTASDKLRKKLNKAGAESIISAIFFLAGSFAKFTYSHNTQFLIEFNIVYGHFIYGMAYLFCFSVATIMAVLVLFKILIIYNEIRDDDNNYL